MLHPSSRLGAPIGGSASLAQARRSSGSHRSVVWQLGIACAAAALAAAVMCVERPSQIASERGGDPAPAPSPQIQASLKAGDALPVGPTAAVAPPRGPTAAVSPLDIPQNSEAALAAAPSNVPAEPAAASDLRPGAVPAFMTDGLSAYTLAPPEESAPQVFAERSSRPAQEAHQVPPPRPAVSAAAETASESAVADPPASEAGALGALVRTSAATPTACLPPTLRDALRETANRFGAIALVSTTSLHSDNHAAGSARARMHLACQAVDFRPPAGQLQAVVAYLRSRRDLGGIEGYRNNVVHIDAKQAPAVARRMPERTAPIVEEGDTSAE